MFKKLKGLREAGSEEGYTLLELITSITFFVFLVVAALMVFFNTQRLALIASVQDDVNKTNANIEAALLKNPTADVIELAATNINGAPIKVGTDTAAAVTVISDDNTTIAVVSTAPDGWKNYQIVGKNSELNRGDNIFSFIYDSATDTTRTEGK